MPEPDQPRYYFSFRSPYSWLAHRELAGRHPGAAAGLRWIPFWEPDARSTAELTASGGRFAYTEMSREKHFYILQDVRRLCVQKGLTVRWPVDRDPHWEVPHLAYFAAARCGRGPDYVAAAFRARWEQGRDICQLDTVRAVAGELDLDPDELAGAVDDPGTRAAGLAALLEIHRDGVFGVPFFVRGREKYWGLERLPDLLAGLASDGGGPGGAGPPATSGAPIPATDGAAWSATSDLSHAGGCG